MSHREISTREKGFERINADEKLNIYYVINDSQFIIKAIAALDVN